MDAKKPVKLVSAAEQHREAVSLQRQKAADIEIERQRRERLKEALRQVTHPAGSEKVETNLPEFWTPDGWSSRFRAAARILKKEGISSMRQLTRPPNELQIAYRDVIELWKAVLSGDFDHVRRELSIIVTDEDVSLQFSYALMDVNDWLAGGGSEFEQRFYAPTTDRVNAIAHARPDPPEQTQSHKGVTPPPADPLATQTKGGTPAVPDGPGTQSIPDWILNLFRGKQYSILKALWVKKSLTEDELIDAADYRKEKNPPDSLRRRITETNKGLVTKGDEIGGFWSIRERTREGIKSYFLDRQK